MDIEQKLKNVFSGTFDVPQDRITARTRQHELPEWDSLGQLRLMMAIEQEFGISFLMNEIAELDSFDAIIKNIRMKLGENV
ncbi:MAG: acyl carrier protein [Candidatus Azobacteroides sp.]|nr:acyl carrier protein [Candidatus Azobacteroides sp.]